MKSESFTKSEQNFEMQLLASTLAHELRNPLQSMRFQIDAAGRGYTRPDTFQSLKGELDRIERIIQKVQRFSQPVQLELQETSFNSLLQSSLEGLRYWIKASGIEIVESYDESSDDRIELDGQLMEQVLLNLLTNAIQAMPEGGQLRIISKILSEEVQLEIVDTGVGMSRETLQKLGSPFFTTKAKGSGLGVAFCRSVLALHEGQIDFESEENKGCRVRIQLPRVLKREERG